MHARTMVPLALLLLGGAGGARAQADDDEWLQRCREESYSRREKFCEVRTSRVRAGGAAVTVEPGRNGGAGIRGHDDGDIAISARIEARAETVAEARELARRVRIVDSPVIRAEGPENERDRSWHVSFRVQVPRRSDVSVRTHNGPVSVADVTGTLRLESENGPISLTRVGGDVRARATNGPISVRLGGERWQGAGLDAETRNGPVSVTIPEGYSAELETGTENGPFHVDFPLQLTVRGRLGRRIETTLGSGGPPVRVVTTNGPVTLRRD